MEHGQGLIFGHIYLVQYAKAPQAGTLAHRSLPEHHLALLQCVRPDKGSRVDIHIHRHVPHGTPKGGGQIFRQHVFSRGLGAGEEQVFPAQQSGGRGLPYLPAVVQQLGPDQPSLCLLGHRVLRPKGPNGLQQPPVYPLLFQFLKELHAPRLLICSS